MIGPIALIAPHALSGRFGRIAPGLLTVLLTACGSPSGPSEQATPNPVGPQPIAAYVLRASAFEGARVEAVSRSGPSPVPAGGPTVTAQSATEAVAGSTSLVSVESATPFQVVYLSVTARSAPPADHLQISLPAPVTNVPLAVTHPSSLPSDPFVINIQVAGANGAVGPVAGVTKSHVPPALVLLGIVYGHWIGTPGPPQGPPTPDPIAGATVSTSLDSRTAVTDARGLFDLRTGVSTTACFTITVSAPGLPTYSERRRFGSDAIVAYTLGSIPQFPIPSPCS